MRSLIIILAAFAAVMALPAGPALSADKPQPELKIEKVETAVYQELYVSETAYQYGLMETLALEGKVLAAVRVAVMPQWTDEIDSARVDAKDIKLVLGGGEEVPMIGNFERYGQFRMSTDSFSEWRPSDWKEKPKAEYYNAVFAVPQGTTSAEFKLGKASVKVDVPSATKEAPNPADTVGVEIVSAGYVNEVRSSNRVGEMKPQPVSVVSGTEGNILEVKIKVSPKMGNGDDPNHFFWYSPWIGIVTQDGLYVPTFGEMFMQRINNNVSHNLNKASDGNFGSGEAAFYFNMPQGASSFKLTYLSVPVAEAEAQPPAAKKEEAPKPAEKEPSKEEKAKDLIKGLIKKTE